MNIKSLAYWLLPIYSIVRNSPPSPSIDDKISFIHLALQHCPLKYGGLAQVVHGPFLGTFSANWMMLDENSRYSKN